MVTGRKGLLIVLSGPSGTGKDSVLREIKSKKRENLKLSVSFTTRPPRKGEVNGKDYYFVSKDEFLNLAHSGEMLEYASYCGNYYGTPRFKVEEELKLNNNVILEIEVQGASQIIEKCPDAVSIFIVPPSVAELRLRLSSRGSETPEIVEKRVAVSKRELEFASNYDYIVINHTVEECAKDILKIIDAECMRTKAVGDIIDEVLKND